MILVTGAAGKTGIAVIEALSKKGMVTRALIHREENEAKVRAAGASDVLLGNMEKAQDMAEAFEGVERIYFIVPNVHPKEVEIGHLAIRAAEKAGVWHFVYHSVLFPQIESMPHHWRKMRVEEALIQSQLAFTILQPANYMQNVLAYWPSIEADGVFRLPYSVEAKSSPVDLRDVVDVATTVLGSKDYLDGSYELAGPEHLSSVDMAALIGSHLGKDVQAGEMVLSDWQENSRAIGLDENRLQTLSQMFSYYKDHSFTGNSQVLSQLLGRQPSTFAEFLAGI